MRWHLLAVIVGSAAIAFAQDAATTQPAIDAPPPATQPAAAAAAEPTVAQLQAEVDRLRTENQALQQTLNDLRSNAGPAWVSTEKFNALKLERDRKAEELEAERATVASLRAELEAAKRQLPTTQPVAGQ